MRKVSPGMLAGWLLVVVIFLFPFQGSSQSLFDDFGGSDESLVDVSTIISVTSATPGEQFTGAVEVTIADHWHINSSMPIQDYLIPAKVSFTSPNDVTISEIQYPEPSTLMLLGEEMSVYDGTVYCFFDLTIDENFTAEELTLRGTFSYQACNDKECKAPAETEFTFSIPVGSDGTAAHQDIFSNRPTTSMSIKPEAVDTEPVSAQEPSEVEQLIAEYGFWGYILALGLAFVTGLLLSFSPCTYPMIPITISIFAGHDRSLGKGFVMSLFYVGTMAVMYGIMGLIVSLIGGVFGAWLANPAVVIGIAIVFVIFSLSMFGLYELQVPAGLRNKLGATKSGGGIGGAIILGVVAALVVSPCVGPFVAGILLYIGTVGNPVFGFLTLFIFAIGLGTLYILIGTFSSSINKLPKAGEWMEQVKKFFGFVLLLMALYFLRTVLSDAVVVTATALLLIVFAVLGGGFDRLTPESPFFNRLKKLLGMLAFIVGLYLLVGSMLMHGFILPKASIWMPLSSTGMVSEDSGIPWQTNLEQGIDKAKASGQPVLIDTWATWCVNCKVLEKETFGHPDVIMESERFLPLKIQLEKHNSPETKQFMKRFGLKSYSLPTVLLLDSNGQVKKIMQGVVSPEEMIEAMKQIS